LKFKKSPNVCTATTAPGETPSTGTPCFKYKDSTFQAHYDMNNPTILVKDYYDTLIAPQGKEFILFENSAHGIFWDEPERFEAEVIKSLDKYFY